MPGTQRRIRARQQPDPAADWGPDLVGGDGRHDENSHAGPNDAPDSAHRGALEQKLRGDVPARCSHGSAQADLASPLHHPHECNVGDANSAVSLR